jgi:hypothetical protein
MTAFIYIFQTKYGILMLLAGCVYPYRGKVSLVPGKQHEYSIFGLENVNKSRHILILLMTNTMAQFSTFLDTVSAIGTARCLFNPLMQSGPKRDVYCVFH